MLEAFSPSGATTTLTFTTSGNLTGSGALAGTTTTTFTPTGALVGTGALQGTSNLAFTTTGAIDGEQGSSGSTSLTFSTSAALTGAGALAGSASVSFASSGALVDANAPVIEAQVIDQGDGRPRDRARAEFERRQDDWKADLRRIIERAFEDRQEQQQAAPVEPLARPEKRRMAQDVLARANFGPMQLSLAEIIAAIDAYQRALIIEQARRDEEDAILALMLSD